MDENTIIVMILAVVALLELTAGIALYRRWDDVRQSRCGLRLVLCAASVFSGLVPPFVLWCIAFVGYLLNVKPMWRLLKSITGATENVIMVYGLAVEGSSRVLWGALLVLSIAGWIGCTITRERRLFLASQVLTVGTFSLPPVLLLLGAIPYVGE